MAPRVVMVFGFPRSGSTVLGLQLQERLDAVFCGELNNLWKRYVRERPCSCGLPLPECEAWSAVAERALGTPYATAEEAAGVQTREQDRLAPRNQAAYSAHLTALYTAMGDVFGREVVVDSSKGVGDARLVAGLDGVDTSFLYLVRDPRGTAYSRSRGRKEHLASGHGKRSPIERWDDYWLARDAREWSAMDRDADALLASLPAERSRTVRYEDFASDPEGVLGSLVDWLGAPRTEDGPPVTTAHVLGGNQGVLRTTGRASVIRPDEAWRSELRPYKRRLLEATSARGRRRHGYS